MRWYFGSVEPTRERQIQSLREREEARGDLPRVRLVTEKGELVLDLFEDQADCFSDRGEIRAGRGDIEGAITDFARASELEPEVWERWFNLGQALGAASRLEEARASLGRALERCPPGDRPQVEKALERCGG